MGGRGRGEQDGARLLLLGLRAGLRLLVHAPPLPAHIQVGARGGGQALAWPACVCARVCACECVLRVCVQCVCVRSGAEGASVVVWPRGLPWGVAEAWPAPCARVHSLRVCAQPACVRMRNALQTCASKHTCARMTSTARARVPCGQGVGQPHERGGGSLPGHLLRLVAAGSRCMSHGRDPALQQPIPQSAGPQGSGRGAYAISVP